MDEKEKTKIIGDLEGYFKIRPDVLFAYVHGSFVQEARFKDIDVAVFLDGLPASPLQVELEFEADLSRIISRYPVDVRVLNAAPLSFRYHVIRHGMAIAVKDEDARSDFVEATLTHYFDFAPFRRGYLKEIFSG